VLGPFIPLAAKLGRLAMELAEGRAEMIELTYLGGLSDYDTRLLTVAALNGVFQGRADGPVNYVNAPLLAKERGLEVREERRPAIRDFTNLLRVTAVRGGQEFTVAGTTLGREHEPRLVRALGYEIEIGLEQLMLFAVNDDRPGMIGRLGTILGEAGVNIANMAVSRNRPRSRALMVLSVDDPVSDDVIARLEAEPGLSDIRFIVLERA
jgi:D-3-phosphoglycerate dehydrogenase